MRLLRKLACWTCGSAKGNYEDDDYLPRASHAGFKLAIARDVFIHHHGNSSFKANNINYLKSLEENRQIFLDKWKDLQCIEQLLDRYFAGRSRLAVTFE
ncbi:MAG: hypothetical protein R3C26_00050 [Calditrichia bacterium]